jgi:protein-tyrosine phosphatase
MKSVLFVCLGNICRSPLAEGIASKIVQEYGLDVVVDSAGTGDWHLGESPCENSQKIARIKGIDISHLRARKVSVEDFDRFELIVALDGANYRDLQKMGAKNLVKLGEYGYGGEDVPDPYFFKGFEGFYKVYEMIESCVHELFRVECKIEGKIR